jgi:hypothetical protein
LGQRNQAFGHHSREIAKAELETQIPPHTEDDDLSVEMAAFEKIIYVQHLSSRSPPFRSCFIRIDTHGAAVFLAGKNVYKVKRAVRFPFMDFSTLDKRRRACERELAVNKADAPGLYLGVVPISKDGSRLKFGRAGKIVEWAVHLRRFDENRTLDRLVKRNELNLDIIAKLASVVAASHRRAPIINGGNAGHSKFPVRAKAIPCSVAQGIWRGAEDKSVFVTRWGGRYEHMVVLDADRASFKRSLPPVP